MRRDLAAELRVVHRVMLTIHNIVVKRVFEITLLRCVIQPLNVGFVFAKQQRGRGIVVAIIFAEMMMLKLNHMIAHLGDAGSGVVVTPCPGVSKPKLRKHVQRRCVCAAIVHGDFHQNIFGVGFGVFDYDVEIAISVEHAGINKLKLRHVAATRLVFCAQARVGKFRLRVFVEHFQIGVRRRRIQVVVKLLNVFAVVALHVVQAEQTFFQGRVMTIP